MMRQYELVERVTAYDPSADEALLNRAYVYAMKAHGSQVRASGDPYFSHPLEVAAILTDLKLDDATIAAALLHDTIEDTSATQSEINELFGDEIGSLVDGLTKIWRLDLMSKEAAQAENLRKLLLAVADDIRVLLVKLADRLHNMRTLEFVSPQKRERIAHETMDIYAPLAGRMGIQQMREELEDLAFGVIDPEARATIVSRLEALRAENGDLLIEIENELKERLAAGGIKALVQGREKRPCSIWRKMQRQTISLGQLSDIFGFRVIVDSEDDCYRALGIVHQAWRMVPGRFKDYVSNPKQNDYRSIHTTVIGTGRQRVELQIRTHRMHDVAERGIAAHAFYKDAVNGAGNGAKGAVPLAKANGKDTNAYRWLRQLIDMLSEGAGPVEFLEHTKLELFQDQVFCFTPKGHLIALPRGATPIDFAYAVHTDVGDSCVGCRINGRSAPLITQLDNGDEVDIVRSNAQTPPAAWESYAATGKARAAIRRATRAAVRRQYAGLGREILGRVLSRKERLLHDADLVKAVRQLGWSDVEDALAAIGRGELAAREIANLIPNPAGRANAAGAVKDAAKTTPAPPPSAGTRERWYKLGNAIKLAPRFGARSRKAKNRDKTKSDDGRVLKIRGHGRDLPLKFSPDGGAVPGDRIVGIVTPGEGITVYPIQAEALAGFEDEPERWVDLAWDVDEDDKVRFPARISVVLMNEPGALAGLASVIGEQDGNISNLSIPMRAADFFEMHLEIEIWSLKHLNRILSEIRRQPAVNSATRLVG